MMPRRNHVRTDLNENCLQIYFTHIIKLLNYFEYLFVRRFGGKTSMMLHQSVALQRQSEFNWLCNLIFEVTMMIKWQETDCVVNHKSYNYFTGNKLTFPY